jgi:hypothetical protein
VAANKRTVLVCGSSGEVNLLDTILMEKVDMTRMMLNEIIFNEKA